MFPEAQGRHSSSIATLFLDRATRNTKNLLADGGTIRSAAHHPIFGRRVMMHLPELLGARKLVSPVVTLTGGEVWLPSSCGVRREQQGSQ